MEKVQAELTANLGYVQGLRRGERLEQAPLRPRRGQGDAASSTTGAAVATNGSRRRYVTRRVLHFDWHIRSRQPVGHWERPKGMDEAPRVHARIERFLGNQAAAGFRGFDDNNFAYKPFGAGRRMCPGLDFAIRLVPLLLASILHRTDWSLPSGMAPKDVDLKDRYSMVLELAKPLHAVPSLSTP